MTLFLRSRAADLAELRSCGIIGSVGNSLPDEKSTWEMLLFRLSNLTTSKEDFLTECFAAVLQEDKRATVEY